MVNVSLGLILADPSQEEEETSDGETVSSSTQQYVQSLNSLSILLRLSDRSFSKSPAVIFRPSVLLLNSTGNPFSSWVIPQHVRTSIFASLFKSLKQTALSKLEILLPVQS